MAQKKKAAAKSKIPRKSFLMGLVGLVVVIAGLLVSYQVGKNSVAVPVLASQIAIASAKQTITTDYLTASAKDCIDPTTNQPYDGVAYFNQYLKVNAYANRATIRACNSAGTLLAKLNGRWVQTEVNLNLSSRANPVWAEACEASDILTPDTVVRPENSSIDATNLKLCQGLQHNKLLRIQDL